MKKLNIKKWLTLAVLLPLFLNGQVMSNGSSPSGPLLKEPVFLTPKVNQHALYVCFASSVQFNGHDYLSTLLASVRGLKPISDEYNPAFEKGIAISDEKLSFMESEAIRISGNGTSVRKLRNILRVTIDNPTNERLLDLAVKLQELPEVLYCNLLPLEPVQPPVDIAPVTPNYEPNQTYIGANPGVNMTYAWGLGLNGAGIRVRDVEYGFNPNHEDLMDRNVAYGLDVNAAVNPDFLHHGTAVFGIVYADKGTYGVSGMAHGASEMLMFSEYAVSGYNRVNAVSVAINNSAAGDVILFEMQTGGQGSNYVPAEYTQAIWDLTRAASDAGIIIVAAAGNGNENLDAPFYDAYNARGNSGAIMVGAGSANVAHDKLSFSTYGARVDVQGWGQSVRSDGYGNFSQIGGDINQAYTSFSGTSSATPVVASCVVVLQSYYFSIHGTYMTSAAMRDLLIQTGIPQGAGGHIGPLPNMQAAIQELTPAAPIANFSANNTSPCQGATVTFTDLTIGAPTSWNWTFSPATVSYVGGTSATSQNPQVQFNAAGPYTVTLVANNGIGADNEVKNAYINASSSAAVTPAISITQTTGTNPICAGANATFTATPVNGGATPAYQWKVNGVNVGTNSSTFTTTTLTNGQVVTCVLTSNHPCASPATATSNSIVMTVNPSGAAAVSITANPSAIICTGNSVTFTATPTNGGTAPAYQWKVNGVNVGTNSPTYTTTTLTNGQTVTCEITSNNPCASPTTATSNGITMTVNAPAALPLTEGFTSATYPPAGWSVINANASTNTWVRNATIGNAPTAGNAIMFDNFATSDDDDDEIRIKVLDFTGQASAQLTFDVAYAPFDASYYDGLQVLVSTDCGATFTSVYSKSNTVLATAAATEDEFTPTAGQWRTETVSLTPYVGQQNVIIAFRNLAGWGNRLFVDNINVTGAAPATADFTVSSATACTGQNVTVTDASTGATSWSWNFGPGATPATATGVGPHNVSYATAGSKTITLTVNGSITSTETVTVNATPATPTISASGPLTFCQGGSVTLTSSSASGNTWSTGATTQSITVSASGTYTVTVASGGCTSAASSGTTVTVNPIPSTPTISASGPLTFCQGGSVTLTSSSATGNTWSTGATTQSITVSASGTYTVTRAANGCTSAASAGTTVTVNPIPSTPTISASGPLTFCQGGSVTLTSSSASGNSWSTGATTQSITVSASGTYTVTVASGGCTSAASSGTTVTVNPIPSTPTISASGPLTFCQGGSVTLTSSSATGNTWSTGATTQSITVSASGTYTVSVTSGSCTSAPSSGTTVTVNPLPVIAIGTVTNPTACASTTGSIQVTGSGTGDLSWSGTATGTLTNVALPATIPTLGAGTYSITFNNGCASNTLSQSLTDPGAPATPIISASGALTFCEGGNVTLTSSSATGNTWSTGETTPSITVSTSGTFTVSVTTAGCTSGASEETVVTVNPIPAAPVINANGALTFCEGGSVTLTSSSATGNTWSNGETSASITVSTAGTYTVTTSENGCMSPASAGTTVVVNVIPATPSISASGPLTFCPEGNVTLTSSSATGNTWSTGATTPSITVSTAGTYTVSVTTDGCTSAASVGTTVTVNENPTVTFAAIEDPCLQDAAFTLTQGSPAGGTYSGDGVSGGQFNPSTAGVGTTTLTYSYTNNDGCSGTATTIVEVDDCLGVEENGTSIVSIYPNPSQGQFTIDAGTQIIESVLVYDNTGRLVQEINRFNGTTMAVDLSHMASGLYTVQVATADAWESISIVLER